MIKRFQSIYEWLILDKPILTLIVFALLTGMFGYYVPSVEFSSANDRFFIEDDPDKVYFERAKKLFGNDQVMIIAMVVPEGEDIYNKDRLTKLRDLTTAVSDKKLNEVQGVVSLTNVMTIQAPFDEKINSYKKEIEVRRLLRALPKSPKEWEDLKKAVNQNPLYKGNLVSEDGRAAAVIIFIKDYSTGGNFDETVVPKIKKILDDMTGSEKYYLAGIPLTGVEIKKRLEQDLKKLLPAAFLCITITLLICYRLAIGVLLPLITIIVSVIWSVGFMRMCEIPITMVTIILPPLMVALGSSYSIHMISEYIAESGPDQDIRDIIQSSTQKVSIPIMICG